MAEQNNINKYSKQLQVNSLALSANTISSSTDLVFASDATNLIQFENATVPILSLKSNGELSNPFQDSFLAQSTIDNLNVTGNGITFTLTFGSIIYDIGNNFIVDTFTAPAAGMYYFASSCVFTGLLSGMTSGRLNLFTSLQTYNSFTNAFKISNSGSLGSVQNSIITKMDQGDVCNMQLTISGSSLTADVSGSATKLRTYFSGHRVA